MDLKQLAHFVAVYEQRSFSRAAQALFISQQGMSRSIGRLEQSLGAALFYRDPVGLSPTEAGHCLYQRAVQLLALSGQAREEVSALSRAQAGRLRVCASYGVMARLSRWLPAGFAQAYPQLRLSIAEYPDVRGEEAVAGGECDVGFTSGTPDPRLFSGQLMFSERLCAVVHESHPLAGREQIGFADLREVPIYIMNRQFHTHTKFVKRCEDAGFTPQIAYETMDMSVVFEGVRAGRGVGIVNAYLAQRLGTPQTRLLAFGDRSFLWDVYMIWHKGRGLSEGGALFRAYLSQRLGG